MAQHQAPGGLAIGPATPDTGPAVPSGHARCAITAPGRRRVLAAQSPAPLAQLITRRQRTLVGGEEMEGNDCSKFVLDADAGRGPSVPNEWMSGAQRDGPDR